MASNVPQKKYPPVPKNPIYADVAPNEYPPKQILEGCVREVDGEEVIHLEWTAMGPPFKDIVGYELHVFAESDEPYDPSNWKDYKMFVPSARDYDIFASLFSRNRRYFFTIRARDDYGRAGPFSDPLCIEL